MTYLSGGCQIFLALVFFTSATGKMLYPDQFLTALRVSGVPRAAISVLAILVVLIEIVVAASLILTTPLSSQAALICALLVLGLFTCWLVWIRVRNISLRCGCFGPARSDVGVGSIMRNLLFIGIATLTLILEMQTTVRFFPPALWTHLFGIASIGCTTYIMTRRLSTRKAQLV